jgi:hypothetical protein
MRANIAILLLLSFVISCNQKEKKSSSDTQQKGQVQNTIKVKKEPERQLVRVLDTIPPKNIQRELEQYKTILTELTKGFPDKNYKWAEIQSIIPRTDKEFLTYYELTYPDNENIDFFETIDSKIFEYAKLDNGDIFFLALNMAQFTDGEYAGSYSAGIEDAVIDNKEKFCIIYKHLSKDSRFRLGPLYKEVCLGIERSPDEEY